MKDLYRETGTLFKLSPLVSPTGEGFAAKVRAVVADHARQLQGMLSQAKQTKGRFPGMAGKKRTTLPGGVLVETWINPNGLVPTLMARVTYPNLPSVDYEVIVGEHGLLAWDVVYNITPPMLLRVGDKMDAYFKAISSFPKGYNFDRKAYLSIVYGALCVEDQYPSMYFDHHFQVAREAQASRYTGLLRLAVQAKQSKALQLNKLCYDPILTYTVSYGLVFDPANWPYSVKIQANKVYIQKLLPGRAFPYGGLEGIHIDRQEVLMELSKYLADLTRIEGATYEEIHTLSGDIEGLPIYHSWKWDYKISRASIVLMRGVAGSTDPDWLPGDPTPQHTESAVFTLTINWTLVSGEYQASVTETKDVDWTKYRMREFTNNVWYPVESDWIGDNYFMVEHGPPWSHASQNLWPENNAPQYCFYRVTGDLEIVTYRGTTLNTYEGVHTDNANEYGAVCGMQPGYWDYVSAGGDAGGDGTLQGFSSSLIAFNPAMQYKTGGNTSDINWEMEPAHSVIYRDNTTAFYQAYNRMGRGCAVISGPTDSPYETRITFAKVSGTDYREDHWCEFQEALIIPPYDAESYFMVRRFKANTTVTKDQYFGSPDGCIFYSAEFKWFKDSPYTSPYLMASTYNANPPDQSLTYRMMAGQIIQTASGVVPRTTHNVEIIEAYVGHANGLVELDVGYQDFSGFFPYGTLEMLPVPLHTWVQTSVGGVVIGAVKNDMFTNDGIEFAPNMPFHSLFVGAI